METKIKFVMADTCNNETDMEADFEKAVEKLYEVDKVFTRDKMQEMLNKAQVIAENLDILEKQAYSEGEDTQATLDGKSLKEQFMQNSKEIPNTKRILVDIDVAYDEFYLMYDKDNYLPNSCYYVEVVTEEVAVENDRDFNSDLPIEDKGDYKVGEILSQYTKLGDSDYYFRFM